MSGPERLSRPLAGAAPAPALMELYAQPGVCGSCILVGGDVTSHDMPYSDVRVADFAARVDQLVASYERVGRTVWQICAGFEKMRLLILVRGSIRLVLLIGREADAVMIAGRAAHLLMEMEVVMPAGDPEGGEPAEGGMASGELRTLLLSLLEKVVGSAQAARLLDLVLREEGAAERSVHSSAEARRIGEAVLGRIPNRAKRQVILAEFHNHLKS